MSHFPPSTLLEVLQQIQYEEALAADDWRYVETQAARGSEHTFQRLARKLGLDVRPEGSLSLPPTQKHILFFGHIGSGKTTELRRYAAQLEASGHYVTVEMDAVLLLDRNNLQYPEVLAAMAQMLFTRLQKEGVSLPAAATTPLLKWYRTLELSGADYKQIEGEIKGELKISGGLLGLIKLFASFTNSAKTGSSTKGEWREKVRNTFTQLADAFNHILTCAEKALNDRRVVFLLDGTDKLRGDDTKGFFIRDAEQLLAIRALVIYTAPLHLKYDGGLVGRLDADLILPMIKLQQRDGTPYPAGKKALLDILHKRAAPGLFEAGVAERLVEYSGGHPRELLRLLKLACEYADQHIDQTSVDRAVQQLASEFRRLLAAEDYTLLVAADQETFHPGNEARTFHLLYNLALMEYNDGSWRRSHPVVRTLEAYQAAEGER